jgi:cytochrome c oxidase subunit 4
MAHSHNTPETEYDFTKDADDPVTLLMVYGAIVALTLVTVGISTQMSLGVLALPIQLGISATQVCLVGYFFMHLKKGERVLVLTALSSLFWMGILFVLVLADYLTRNMIVG